MNADSIKARLKNKSQATGKTLQELLVAYGLERTIYRISKSRYSELFTLKGGIFLYALFDGNFVRATTDIDLLANRIDNDPQRMKQVFAEIFSMTVDDPLRYDINTLNVKGITEFKEYHGVNVSITAYLDRTKIWRCISRLDYGKKYCPDSSTVEEESLQDAIVECIKQVIKDESGYAVIESLKHHIAMYFTKDDENSTAEDEAKAAELIQAITQAAKTGHFTAEIKGMVEELNRLKAVIKDKKSKQSGSEKSTKRMEEIMVTTEELKDTPIAFDNYAIRQIIDCIKVISEDEITIIFKGGFERTVPLK